MCSTCVGSSARLLGKLERLLGNFTEDAHLRLNLTLALHVLNMRGI